MLCASFTMVVVLDAEIHCCCRSNDEGRVDDDAVISIEFMRK